MIILSIAAFFGAFEGLATLFDSMGFKPGASGMMAMAIIWCMIAGGAALKFKYDKVLKEIRERDEKIMRGLKG